MWLQKILNKITLNSKDENFLGVIEKIQDIAAKFLSIAIVIVILVVLADLAFFLFKELFSEHF